MREKSLGLSVDEIEDSYHRKYAIKSNTALSILDVKLFSTLFCVENFPKLIVLPFKNCV